MLDDPDYLPFKLDLANRRLLMLCLTAQQRAEAAFLDERALPAQPQAAWISLSMLAGTPAPSSSDAADFIFHIGHCGSTLLSRLLQSWQDVQMLREPLPLRTLAAAREDGGDRSEDVALLQRLIGLWSRPLPGSTRTVIKATSNCNGLIEPILQSGPARALLLALPLAPYLATLFKAEASIGDALSAEPARKAYLQRCIRTPAPPLRADGVPERCALGWLAERLRFHALAHGPHAARVLRIDFEDLLARPEQVLWNVAAHLRLSRAGLTTALASPAWARYSKAQSHAYDAADRRHDLALAQRRFAPEIEAGKRWLEGFFQTHPRFAIAGRG